LTKTFRALYPKFRRGQWSKKSEIVSIFDRNRSGVTKVGVTAGAVADAW